MTRRCKENGCKVSANHGAVSANRRVGCEKSAGVAEFSVLCLPQLLIYAQRPDAVAVAELGTWNKLFKRWVNKDSKGIAVFDPKGRRNTLKYYFDISDTHEGYYGSRPVPIWQMDERYEQAVKERL